MQATECWMCGHLKPHRSPWRWTWDRRQLVRIINGQIFQLTNWICRSYDQILYQGAVFKIKAPGSKHCLDYFLLTASASWLYLSFEASTLQSFSCSYRTAPAMSQSYDSSTCGNNCDNSRPFFSYSSFQLSDSRARRSKSLLSLHFNASSVWAMSFQPCSILQHRRQAWSNWYHLLPQQAGRHLSQTFWNSPAGSRT